MYKIIEMKVSFFTAVIVALVASNANAVRTLSMPENLAELDHCNTVKVNIPEC